MSTRVRALAGWVAVLCLIAAAMLGVRWKDRLSAMVPRFDARSPGRPPRPGETRGPSAVEMIRGDGVSPPDAIDPED